MREPLTPSGYCVNGHCQKKHAFVDSDGKWRCRPCRKEAYAERDYWRLVNRVMADDRAEDAMEKLKRYHWITA